jgi:uncharacterized membrane protein
MMSQNRQDAKDRLRGELDYRVNLKAEVEISRVLDRLDRVEDQLDAVLSRGAAPGARRLESGAPTSHLTPASSARYSGLRSEITRLLPATAHAAAGRSRPRRAFMPPPRCP